MNQTIEETITNISKAAIPRPDKRVIKEMKPGQMIRQGDVYLINITEMKNITVFNNIQVDFSEYTSQVKSNKKFYQLVPGSTMGSRHQVNSNSVKILVNPTNRSTLVGPIIHAKTSFDVIHPEHAHFNLPTGDYLVCYQLNDKTKERVKD